MTNRRAESARRIIVPFCGDLEFTRRFYRLEEPIMKILYWAKTVFTRSAITPPKVNRFWMKFGVWAKFWGLARQVLGAIRTVATVLEASEILSGKEHTIFRFLVGQILRRLNTTTSIGEAVKKFRNRIFKFYHKGSFSPKSICKIRKIAHKFSGLSISGCHNSAMTQWLQIAGNSLSNWSSTGCLLSILPLESIQSLSPELYVPHKKGTYPNFRQRPMSDIAY